VHTKRRPDFLPTTQKGHSFCKKEKVKEQPSGEGKKGRQEGRVRRNRMLGLFQNRIHFKEKKRGMWVDAHRGKKKWPL